MLSVGIADPVGRTPKMFLVRQRQSLVGLHSRSNTGNKQKFPVRGRGRKITLIQELEVMALERGEHRAKEKGVESNALGLL